MHGQVTASFDLSKLASSFPFPFQRRVLSLLPAVAHDSSAQLYTMDSQSYCQKNILWPGQSDCPDRFDFSLLFEQSFLSLVPSSLLILTASFRIVSLKSKPRQIRGRKFLLLKLVATHILRNSHQTRLTKIKSSLSRSMPPCNSFYLSCGAFSVQKQPSSLFHRPLYLLSTLSYAAGFPMQNTTNHCDHRQFSASTSSLRSSSTAYRLAPYGSKATRNRSAVFSPPLSL